MRLNIGIFSKKLRRKRPLQNSLRTFSLFSKQQPKSPLPVNLLLTSVISIGVGTYFGIRFQKTNTLLADGAAQLPVKSKPQNFRDTIGVVSALKELLPPDRISTDHNDLMSHRQSAQQFWEMKKHEILPCVVVYPESTKEVSEIVKLANKHNVPIIAVCGSTSIVGYVGY